VLAEKSRDRDIEVIAQRNLGIAAMTVRRDPVEAARRYAAARRLAPDDARLFTEEDQLMEFRGTAAAERLERLLTRPDLTDPRDDLTVRTARLLAEGARFEEAVAVLRGRRFQPWEGGEGQVLAAWELAMLGRAGQALEAGRPTAAVALVDEAIDTPAHLGEARHPLTNAAELHWWRGRCLDAAGDAARARAAWERTAAFEGDFSDLATSRYSAQTVYSVLALRALGRWDEAHAMVADLSDFTENLAETPAGIDYFATSLPSMLLFHQDPQHTRDQEVAALRVAVAALRSDSRSLVEPARRPGCGDAP